MSRVTKVLFALACLCVTFAPTGCNTVEGLGNDISSVGSAGKRAITGEPSTKPAN